MKEISRKISENSEYSENSDNSEYSEYSDFEQKKESSNRFDLNSPKLAATYSPKSFSTIGAAELNFSVRNGKRWNLSTITTYIL